MKIKRIVLLLLVTALIVALVYLLLVKVNTKIYIGDYAYGKSVIDIEMSIDGVVVLKDSLYSSPFFPTIVEQKMRYGLHKVRIVSEKAKVDQESTIFLLPNQFISIEFFGVAELYKDGYEFVSERIKSEFFVQSLFNPFYTE